jgi:hypothetical protein
MQVQRWFPRALPPGLQVALGAKISLTVHPHPNPQSPIPGILRSGIDFRGMEVYKSFVYEVLN